MKPAWPRLKRPVKPLSRFMETATRAYMAPFLSTMNSMELESITFSSTNTMAYMAIIRAMVIMLFLLSFFIILSPSLIPFRWPSHRRGR